jgi:hypothetical protein
MDVLSEVLKVVRLQGAMFYNGEFSAPWSFRSPASCNVAPFVAAGAEHVIIYHLLTEGRASARVEDGERLDLEAGDVVIFPHGDPHIIENGKPIKTVDLLEELARIFSQGLRLARAGGEGDVTKFVCGYMACEPRLSQVFLSGLPPVFKSAFATLRADGWKTRSAFPSTKRTPPRPGERRFWQGFRKSCLSKHCGCTFRICHRNKLVGWPAPAIRKSEKRWR